MYRPNKIIQKVISSRTREIFRSFASAKKSFGEENFLQMAILSTQLVNILMKRSSVHINRGTEKDYMQLHRVPRQIENH